MMGGRKEKGTDYRELEKKNTDTSFDIFNVFSVPLLEVASGSRSDLSPPSHN